MSFITALEQTELGSMLVTFLVSMVPVLELRGAIPLGVSLGLDHLTAMVLSILGNMVPVPFIILFIRKIFAWLAAKSPRIQGWIARLEQKAEGKWDKVHAYQFWGLMVLVAIPLPGEKPYREIGLVWRPSTTRVQTFYKIAELLTPLISPKAAD